MRLVGILQGFFKGFYRYVQFGVTGLRAAIGGVL